VNATRISSRIRRIKPSASSAAADRFAELRRQGKDIINFAIGEPDFDTPEHIRQAAHQAIDKGETRYTAVAGTLALRQAIVAKLKRENGLDYEPRDVIVTCGAKHALFNALSVTVDAGHEVIVPAPFWVSYPDMVLACDGTPVIVTCKEEDDFRLTPDVLEAAITPSTRWLVLNSPTNPTGTTYTTGQLRALAGVLVRHPQVMVLTDDIYEHIRFGGPDRPKHLLEIEPALRDRTLVVNGVSKTYAMTGWRVGYAVGPADIIAAMDMLQSQSTSGACSISQAAAVAALNTEADFLPGWVAQYQLRRDTAVRMLNEIPGIRCRAPGGAFYLYPWCGGLIGRRTPEGKLLETDSDVVIYLLEAGGVMLLAGTAYGVSPYFRMSTATSVELIEDGCRRIARAVAALA
jgi:aspartate aminotransferase